MASLRDLRANLGAQETIRPQVVTGDVDGETVDTRGFDSTFALIQTGTVAGSGVVNAILQESDNDADWDPVAAADLLGSVDSPLAANSVYRLGYAGAKRYLRVHLDHVSGTSVAASASIVLGHPAQRPVA